MLEQKNNDTKSKLGDTYHYYIVLEHCLRLQENEVLYVEKYGDISIASDHNSMNLEIKHHDTEHVLNDRNKDFWVTLRNWVKYHHNMMQFKQLILFTTSIYSDSSFLSNWNSSNPFEKLEFLKAIGREEKHAEKVFRPLYEEILSYDEKIILEIIAKIELHLHQVNISNIEKVILQNSFFRLIQKRDRKAFINYLMGYILTLPVAEVHGWQISNEDFNSVAYELRERFRSKSRPLQIPPNISDFPPDMQEYFEKKFVKEIKDILYDTKINAAISNYWRAQQTIYYTSIDNPIFGLDLGEYQKDLKEALSEYKTSSLDMCDTTNSDDIIHRSKRLYDKAMEHSVSDFGTVSPNRGYFQKGIIHKIVEERGFSWNVTK
jgi:hypothetical protein